MCDPILVTLSKMRPHYRQFSRENATPSSGTSPLASYREVPSPPPGQLSENPNLTGNTVIIMIDWEFELRATLTLDLLRVDLTSLNRTKDFFESLPWPERAFEPRATGWEWPAAPHRRFYGGTYRVFLPKEKQQQRQQNKQTENYSLIED